MGDDDLQMEHGFLKAPWEVLMRSYRSNHKGVIKDADSIANATSQLVREAREGGVDSNGNVRLPPERVELLITRLQALQQRLELARAADKRGLDTCHARMEHLARRKQTKVEPEEIASTGGGGAATAGTTGGSIGGVGGNGGVNGKSHPLKRQSTSIAAAPVLSISSEMEVSNENEALARWEKVRLDRVLVDYMLRSGLYGSGLQLSKSESIDSLVDIRIFEDARKVIGALRSKDCSAALNWCIENKRRLGKNNSTFEFQLHRQVCIEYARIGEKLQAIEYARKHLSIGTVTLSRHREIGAIMGLMIFKPTTRCQPYKNMYSQHKWIELEEKFKQENYRLHGLTSESTLEILLKTGVSSLKTRKCSLDRQRNSKCPVCNEPYSSLGENLPRAQHINSVLVCSISGAIMDENNPPMALPNGNVYGFNALQDIAVRNNNQVIDPKTDESFAFSRLRKCYIM